MVKELNEAQVLDEKLMFLSLGPSAYKNELSSRTSSLEDRLAKLYENEENIEARGKMARAVLRLDYLLWEKEVNSQNRLRSYDLELQDTVEQIAT